MKILKNYWNPKNIFEKTNALSYFKSTVRTTNKGRGYFNNWSGISAKVDSLDKKVVSSLNKVLFENFDKEAFKEVVKKDIKTIPVIGKMLITNDREVHIIDGGKDYKFDFNKKSYTEEEYTTLFSILDLTDFYVPITQKLADSLENYLKLVLVGMDTNGRKNRSGTSYETSTRNLLDAFCDRHNFKRVSGANEKKVESFFGKKVLEQIKKTGKKIPDYVFQSQKNIYLVETNYSDGGSKLQETIKSYVELNSKVRAVGGVVFIYLTDGKQWTSNSSHLEKGWDEIDYMININMVSEGILDHIIEEEDK